jgi:tRNA-specific 2-thiouridylase
VGGELYRGADDDKDQTYFLWGVDRHVLPRVLLPVGGLTKKETRALATELGLANVAAKPESQEICFVPDGNYSRVLEERLGANHAALAAGPLLNLDGDVIGEHDGYARFTVGQRRGLPGGSREPIYVVAIQPATRAVVVGPRDALLGKGLCARSVNWLVAEPPRVGERVFSRVRHRAPLAAGEILALADGEVEIGLDEPVSAITAGQSLVLYDERGRVLGGGFIEGARMVRNALPVLSA